VLVVDDDRVVRLLASRALARIGFDVEEAEDGERGLAAVDRCLPDLIVLDIEMPGIDGYEVCATLRGRPYGRDVPVLMITGNGDGDAIDRSFEVGATDFIAKPFDWRLLEHRVRFLMRASDALAVLSRTFHELRESRERLAHAQQLARIGNWEWRPGADEMLWSDEVYRILGLQPGTCPGSYERFVAAVHPLDRPALEKAMQTAASEATGWSLDHRLLLPSGQESFAHQQAEIVVGPSGACDCVMGTIQDITERKRAEERIRQLAYYDSLTALPNRRMLEDFLRRIVERARKRARPLAVLYLDLDRFKRLNDTLGHLAGDQVLIEVARRLTDCVRATDCVGREDWRRDGATVSRLGGDEFTIVLSEIRSPEDAAIVANRVLAFLQRPFAIDGHEVTMNTSIGIAVFPGDGEDAATLLRHADVAMYHAKGRGAGRFEFFGEALEASARRRATLESELRVALERGGLGLGYQPAVHAGTGRPRGAQALLRWRRSDGSDVSPAELLPLAEDVGLIGPLGEWMLRTACAQSRAWREAGLPILPVGVDVSIQQLRRPGFVETVERTLREFGLDPGHLELELGESAFRGDDREVLDRLNGLSDLGVRLALDDFGAGESSLPRLVQRPIHTIKLDRSLVGQIDTRGPGHAIIPALILMARRLGLVVTAQGVETEGQRRFLREEGCDALQGHLIAPPLEPEEFQAWLRKEGWEEDSAGSASRRGEPGFPGSRNREPRS
jgi:diguanylate cyclase (GGDEF)-like protein